MPTIKTAFREKVLPEMITLRCAIHRRPDLSAREEATVARLIDYLTPFEPKKVHTDLGGCGLAVVFAEAYAGILGNCHAA